MTPTSTESERLANVSDRDRLAFDGTASDRAAKIAEAWPAYALDAFYAAGKALWTAPRVMRHREALLTLPDYDIRHLDRYDDLARALRFVQTAILRRIQRSRELPAMAAEGWRIRREMLDYAALLSRKGLVAPELVARVRSGGGYLDLAKDLSVLVQELLALPEVHTGPHAVVTRADLSRASEIADHVSVFVRTDPDVDETDARLRSERRKVGGMLLEAHDEIRRGMTFFRWKHKDVAKIVPSLRVPRGKQKRRDPATEPPADIAALHAADTRATPEIPDLGGAAGPTPR